MRRLYLLISLLFGAVIFYGCDLESSQLENLQPTADFVFATAIPTRQTPFVDKTPSEMHLTLPSGLRIDEYALQDAPKTEPLVFVPLEGSQQDILSQHQKDRFNTYRHNSFFDNGYTSISADFSDQNLVAREVISLTETLPAQITVEVMLDDSVIYSVSAGDVSPLNPLQGFWAYDGGWIVEVATVSQTYDERHNENVFRALGHLIKDGEDLNQRFAYQETFGFQLLDEKPFYFFSRDGEIGFSYDDEETSLGYGSVPHYGCCSAAELNPRPAKDMVSFFAQKSGRWYYVEIGVFE